LQLITALLKDVTYFRANTTTVNIHLNYIYCHKHTTISMHFS